MLKVFSEAGLGPDVMDLLEQAWFTQKISGRESFHQLNTLTLTQSLNGVPCAHHVYRHTHTQACTHGCIKINTPTQEACVHAIPCVCTITEEVNLIKGQRTQRDSWQGGERCTGARKRARYGLWSRGKAKDDCFHSCQPLCTFKFYCECLWCIRVSFVCVCV